jgi:hypothetical protein
LPTGIDRSADESVIFDDQSAPGWRSKSMLWTIVVILLVLWLIGWLGFHMLGGAIHILILLAMVVALIALIRRV